DGTKTTQLANVLVPGDLITFSTGDRIPADLRLTSAHQLDIDESTLTGETHPARKQVEAISNDGTMGVGGLPISERRNIAFMGTLVRNGRGEGVVVGTGVQSEFGVVFAMMQEIGDRKTPLQLSMDELAKKLSAISFGVIGVIVLIGVFQKRSWLEMFTIGVSLAVAAIPEGLPIVVTVTLALGVLRMSKRKAIVKKLPSVETLGSVSVICSDKTETESTGTLTTNVMTVTKAYTVDEGVFDIDVLPPMLNPSDARARLFLVGNICNSTYTDRGRKNVGQATEVALMNALPVVGLRDQRESFIRKHEIPFSSETKFQSISGVFTSSPTSPPTTYLTGAIEVVLSKSRFYLRTDLSTASLSPEIISLVLSHATSLASNGLRIVGMASGPDPDALVFAGFQGMMDPPRKGVDKAIAQLAAGGIQVVMITGDSPETALSIARQLGIRVGAGNSGVLLGKDIDLLSQRQLSERISGVSVFARTTPRHKMAIIEAFQSRGAVVAMTGDGVNDAPALKMADIGVAMGRGGTDVAKEAADVILVDDNFATLLPAVEEGKSIFLNIQNFLVFQLSTAVSALSLITLSTALGLPNPLNAMQILWINVIMDGPPAQSLGVDPVNRDIMRRPPRPKNTPILSKRLLQRVAFSAIIIVCGVLFVLARELGDGSMASRDQTMTFTSFVFLDLASALQNRGLNVPLLFGSPNKLLLLTVSISFIAQLSLIYVPWLQSLAASLLLSGLVGLDLWRKGSENFWLVKFVRKAEGRQLVTNIKLVYPLHCTIGSVLLLAYIVDSYHAYVNYGSLAHTAGWRGGMTISMVIEGWLLTFGGVQAYALTPNSYQSRLLSPRFLNFTFAFVGLGLLIGYVYTVAILSLAGKNNWGRHISTLKSLQALQDTWDGVSKPTSVDDIPGLPALNAGWDEVQRASQITFSLLTIISAIIWVINFGSLALLFKVRRQIFVNTKELGRHIWVQEDPSEDIATLEATIIDGTVSFSPDLESSTENVPYQTPTRSQMRSIACAPAEGGRSEQARQIVNLQKAERDLYVVAVTTSVLAGGGVINSIIPAIIGRRQDFFLLPWPELEFLYFYVAWSLPLIFLIFNIALIHNNFVTLRPPRSHGNRISTDQKGKPWLYDRQIQGMVLGENPHDLDAGGMAIELAQKDSSDELDNWKERSALDNHPY
ncbi:hypothetical protein P7C70_g1229, partial [Phenoliferia sp. Uapishka_3]